MQMRIVFGLLSALIVSAPAFADLKIGFIDPRPILNAASESKAGKQHAENMEKFVKEKQAAIKKDDDALRAQGQAMEKEMLTLSDAQKEQKQKDFQQKLVALRNKAKDAEQEKMRRDAEFNKILEDEIRKAVNEVAREEKINLVLSRSEVLYTDTGVDLTERVVNKLAAALQKLEGKGGKK